MLFLVIYFAIAGFILILISSEFDNRDYGFFQAFICALIWPIYIAVTFNDSNYD